MRDQYADDPMVNQAQQVIRDDFRTAQSLGTLRLRGHPLFRPSMDVVQFISELRELLGVP